MFPNKKLRDIYSEYTRLLNFKDMSWWLIDLSSDPNIFYCNETMAKTFELDDSLVGHDVAKTCPIAGDFNKNIAIRSSEKAQQIFREYYELRNNRIEEYRNSFPYYDAELDETLHFTSRARVLTRDENNAPEILFGIIEPETMTAELYEKARTDGLTGLFNRREFDTQLEFMVNIANREQRRISLVLCDIDHFKNYNDMLGHFAGDECLVQIAQSISRVCERNGDFAFRYGGEEFAIISYGNDNVSELAESLRSEVYIRSIPHPQEGIGPVTLSVGYCSVIPGDQTVTASSLFQQADESLYRAKDLGRNQCVDYLDIHH